MIKQQKDLEMRKRAIEANEKNIFKYYHKEGYQGSFKGEMSSQIKQENKGGVLNTSFGGEDSLNQIKELDRSENSKAE